MLAPTPLASHRKQLQRWGGKFFHTPPIALIWHPPTTIFSDLWRISCADVMRQWRQFRKQCVSVFGWLEQNFTEGEFSNSQNAGRNVYKKWWLWKNKERSVDYSGVFGLSILKHVTLQKIVAHDFWYDPHNYILLCPNKYIKTEHHTEMYCAHQHTCAKQNTGVYLLSHNDINRGSHQFTFHLESGSSFQSH